MNTMPTNTVSVKTVDNERGDLTHCEITIGKKVILATFSDSSSELRERVLDECGVELSTAEVMAVTNASRQQMETEAGRLKAALMKMPAGTVAEVRGGLSFWLDVKGELAWNQWLTIGKDAPDPQPIGEVGAIDTEELWDMAESIREWLVAPVAVMADLQWLHQASVTAHR